MNYYYIFIFLGVCSFFDIKKKQLPCVFLWFGTMGMIALSLIQIVNGTENIWDCLEGAFVGGLLLLFSKASREQIGLGDGAVFFITGLGLGVMGNIVLLMNSLFLTCVVSVILLLLKKVNRKTSLPFVPFVWGGFILEWVCKGL